MNYLDHLDKNIPLPAHSFIALIHYKRKSKEFFLVLRSKGQRYKYLAVPVSVFADFCKANNKGSFISQQIIHNGSYKCVPLDPMPMAILEKFTMPQSKKFWLGR
jgi:hypothetical protein